MRATSSKTLLLLGGVALVFYPFALLANLMTLAGHRTGNEPMIAMAVVYVFLAMTTIYPAVYVAALFIAMRAEKAGG